MAKLSQISDQDFKQAFKSSISIRESLIKLNVIPAGGNYWTAKKRIQKLKINTEHFLGKGYLKGQKIYRKKIPLSEILTKNSNYHGSTSKLKKRLIEEKIFISKCYSCFNTTWLGNPIPLELEHKNGIRNDNRIENLTLLCPNCHALTDTYRGKNINQKYKRIKKQD